MPRNGTVLVIDDEEMMREVLETLLEREGYEVRLAASGNDGLELARSVPFDAAIVDVMMPGIDGIETLEELKKIDDELPVVMITAFASVETALAAMKRGAFDYITKPFKNDEVLAVLRNATERRRLVIENRALRQSLQARYHKFANIIGRSPRMRQVFDLIIQAAPSRSTILIQGESGTGKELVARAIHTNSPRSDRPFITVNSGNLPPDLLESNLFGHVKGAFTGAVYPKKGLCELADKGSIFFDEISNVPIETQSKLLRVMQEREFMRLGGVETIRVDVRIIAATNVDLKRMVDDGRFREDLYYRLHVITIELPPLRERKEDIPLLVQHFLEKYGEENRKTGVDLSPEALDLLMDYDWPGNVRELENVIERAVVLSAGPRVGADLIPEHVRSARPFQIPHIVVPPEGISLKEVITDFEKRLIESTLEAAGGVQKRAAELLHVKPTTLNEMIKRYEIRPRRRRGESGGGRGLADRTAAPGEPEEWPASGVEAFGNGSGDGSPPGSGPTHEPAHEDEAGPHGAKPALAER
jgi:two-component system response regulator PilR (NtrC family)